MTRSSSSALAGPKMRGCDSVPGERYSGPRSPEERLLAVAEHYEQFGGVSPINAQVRDLISELEPELAQTESRCPFTGAIGTGTQCSPTRWPG